MTFSMEKNRMVWQPDGSGAGTIWHRWARAHPLWEMAGHKWREGTKGSLRWTERRVDALVSLHWLRIPERIQYKIAVLSYKILHDTTPRYLGPLTRVADIPGRRALRSACTDRLEVPYFKLSSAPSAAELFRLPPHRSGTHYQTQSFRHQHCGRSSTNWKRFYFNDPLSIRL